MQKLLTWVTQRLAIRRIANLHRLRIKPPNRIKFRRLLAHDTAAQKHDSTCNRMRLDRHHLLMAAEESRAAHQ